MTPQQFVVKAAGILDPLLYAPFSALAATITGPSGARGKAGALGALLGAGVASLAQKEYEDRRARGEPVSPTDFQPLIRAVMAGIATGGTLRAAQEQRQTGQVGALSAILAGAPAGALLLGDHPIIGAVAGSIAAPHVARLVAPGAAISPTEGVRAGPRSQRALEAAEARFRVLRAMAARRVAEAPSPTDVIPVPTSTEPVHVSLALRRAEIAYRLAQQRLAAAQEAARRAAA